MWMDTMKISHHNLAIELNDSWWAEAAMDGFKPTSTAYRVRMNDTDYRNIFEVKIDEVRPVRRDPGVAIFNDSAEATARERVVSILRGFRSGAPMPPVEVVSEPAGSLFRYKLVHGAHRFYCSVAVGFSHVPAVMGFDTNAPG